MVRYAIAAQRASIGEALIPVRQELNNAIDIATVNAPTILTSHISVFGPVTFMKLEMSTSGHNPVRK